MHTCAGVRAECGRGTLDPFGGPAALVEIDSPYAARSHVHRAPRVVGQGRSALAHYAWSTVDVRPRSVGAVDFDERRWSTERVQGPSAALGADSSAGVQCDEIASLLVSLPRFEESQPATPRSVSTTPFDVFNVAASATPDALRSAYRRLWDSFRRESPLTRYVVPRQRREMIISRRCRGTT